MPVKDQNGGPVAADIASRIRNDFLKSDTKKIFLPAERALMEEYGVARNTVRHALNHLADKGLIRAEHGRGYRVLADEAGHVLPQRIAVLQASETSARYGGRAGQEVLEALQRQSLKRKWQVLNLDVEDMTPQELLRILKDANVQAVAQVLADESIFKVLSKAGLPCVVLEGTGRELPVDYIFQDNFGGARRAAHYLLNKGHRRIAWVGARTESLIGLERWYGAKSALAQRGLDFGEDVVIQGSEGLEENVRALLSSDNPPTGILALWRRQVVAVVKVCASLDLKIGEDVDVVGWSTEKQLMALKGEEFSGRSIPVMVAWDPEALAEVVVARLLLHRIEPGLKPLHIAVPTRLVLPEKDRGQKDG